MELNVNCSNDVLVPLEELFTVHPGIASSEVNRIKVRRNSNWIPYIRPSYRQNTGIDAYVNRHLIDTSYIFPSGTLYVSTDGQGSHTYSYVSTETFVPNSNISVLLPHRAMTLREKLYYAMCITHNRFKFSYGRKPKGKRLASILLPAEVPDTFIGAGIQTTLEYPQADLLHEASNSNCSISYITVDELFEVVNGLPSSEVIRSKVRKNSNWIPYIRPSYRQNTGIDAYVNRHLIDTSYIFPSGTLYVSTDGQGSHTYSYVSTETFVPNSNVSVLLPRRVMTLREKLYYAMCITHNRFKFSYGRKPKGDRLKEVIIPSSIPGEYNELDLHELVNSLSDVKFGALFDKKY